jgi:hypothetical protein
MRAWPLALFMVACGSDPISGDGAAGSPSSGEGGSGGDTSVECDDGPGYARNPEPAPIENVEATVLDETGAPYADSLVQVCGLDICVNGFTDENGMTSVSATEPITQAAFKYGDGLGVGKFALPLEPSETVFDLGVVRTVRLPESREPIRAGSTSTSDEVSLTLPANASVEFDLLVYREEEQQAFRAAELDLTSAPDRLLGDSGVELAFALAPLDTEFCPAATLELPNRDGWEPGTEIEFLLHGLDLGERFAPYAGWAVIGRGEVDESGERLVMLEGGMRTLGSVGVRRR